MGQRPPLSDDWLFWDAERLETYPHSEYPPPDLAREGRSRRKQSARKPLQLRLLEDLLLYAAGMASALMGVGLVVLLGSFISAYSVLSEVNRSADKPIVEYPAVRANTLELLADAAATAGKHSRSAKPPVTGSLTANTVASGPGNDLAESASHR